MQPKGHGGQSVAAATGIYATATAYGCQRTQSSLDSIATADGSQGYKLWQLLQGNDAKPETPLLWPPHVKSWLIGKDSDAGRDWGQEEKGMTEDEMAGWHHWLDGRESGWTPGVGQGGLACCDSWGHKESDTTARLNWTELKRANLTFGLCVPRSRFKVLTGTEPGSPLA